MALQPGDRVTAYWTHDQHTYQAPAEVAWLSADHVTVRLVGPVLASDGAPAQGTAEENFVAFSRHAETDTVRLAPSAVETTGA